MERYHLVVTGLRSWRVSISKIQTYLLSLLIFFNFPKYTASMAREIRHSVNFPRDWRTFRSEMDYSVLSKSLDLRGDVPLNIKLFFVLVNNGYTSVDWEELKK